MIYLFVMYDFEIVDILLHTLLIVCVSWWMFWYSQILNKIIFYGIAFVVFFILR